MTRMLGDAVTTGSRTGLETTKPSTDFYTRALVQSSDSLEISPKLVSRMRAPTSFSLSLSLSQSVTNEARHALDNDGDSLSRIPIAGHDDSRARWTTLGAPAILRLSLRLSLVLVHSRPLTHPVRRYNADEPLPCRGSPRSSPPNACR